MTDLALLRRLLSLLNEARCDDRCITLEDALGDRPDLRARWVGLRRRIEERVTRPAVAIARTTTEDMKR